MSSASSSLIAGLGWGSSGSESTAFSSIAARQNNIYVNIPFGRYQEREPGASQRGALTRCRRLHDGQQVGCAKVVLRGESVGFLRG